jgi:hypothetical protein
VGLGALVVTPDMELRSRAVVHLALARANIHDRVTRVAISTALVAAAATLAVSIQDLEASATS